MVALAITVTTALAASSRAEYIAQADPICAAADRPVGKAIRAYLIALRRKGLLSHSSEVTEKTIGPTARFGRRISLIYGNVTAGLRAISPAPGDEQTVAIWLQDRDAVRMGIHAEIRAYQRHRLKHGRRLETVNDKVIARTNAAGRGLGLQTECVPSGGALFEFGSVS